MAGFVTVAQGTSFSELGQTVADMNLSPGTEIRVEMELIGGHTFEWLFDLAGAELVFGAFVPDGLDVVDVWGADSKGFVLMKVAEHGTSAAARRIAVAPLVVLSAVLAFIRANWLSIVIAGFVIATIVSFIIVSVRVATQIPVLLAVGLGVLGISLLVTANKGRQKALT